MNKNIHSSNFNKMEVDPSRILNSKTGVFASCDLSDEMNWENSGTGKGFQGGFSLAGDGESGGGNSWIVCGRTIFVGVDVGKEENKARAIIENQSRVSNVFSFPNRRKGFEDFARQLSNWLRRYDCEAVKIAMEPTGVYYKPLFAFLQGRGFDVRTVRSLNVKQYKEMKDNSKLKTDEKDAFVIADLLFTGNSVEQWVYDAPFRSLKILWNLYYDNEKSRSQWKNRIEPHLFRIFPEIADVFSDIHCKTARKLFKNYPFPEDVITAGVNRIGDLLHKESKGNKSYADATKLLLLAKESIGEKLDVMEENAVRMTISNIIENLERFDENIKKIVHQLNETLAMIPYSSNLLSIEGMGIVKIAGILAAVGDIRRYNHSNQLIKKLGLNLQCQSSGKKKGQDKISRRGNGSARQQLHLTAMYHAREGTAFYEKYRAMVDRGVKKMKALTAIERKLLKVIFALVREDRKFIRRGAR